MRKGIGVIGIAALLLAVTVGPRLPIGGQVALAADEEKEMAAVKEKVSQVAQAALVRLRFEFQKDPEEGMPEDDREISENITNRTTWDTSGILLQPGNTIMMSDSMQERRYIKKITVLDAAGNEYEAELKGFLREYPAAFLNIKGDKKPAGGITFAEVGELAKDRKFYATLIFEDNENWFTQVIPVSLAMNMPFEAAPKSKPWLQISAGCSRSVFAGQSTLLLFDEKAQPIGFPLEGRVEPGGNRYGWRGTELVKAAMIDTAAFDKKLDDVKKAYADYILEAKFFFRQPEKEKAERGGYNRYSSRTRYGGSDDEDEDNLDITEKKMYGLAVDKTHLLIPAELSKDLVHRIEKIEVTIGDKKCPAKFLGVYEDFSGMLIELTDQSALPKAADIYKTGAPELGRAVLTLRVKDKFDRRYEKAHYDRFTAIARGYKNKLQSVPQVSGRPGVFFIGFEGEPIAVMMTAKRELADRVSEDRGYYGGYSRRGQGDTKPFFFNDLKKYLTEPTAYFDKKLLPLSDREMKRIIWLGVEFQTLTKELAEQLNCQKITREGQLGLLVAHIYDDSPASKAGLKTTDILLKIKEEGKEEIELSGKGGGYDFSEIYSRYSGGDDDDDFSGYAGSGMTPWPAASNYLNQILTQIGEGKKMTLTYLRDGKELTQEFTLKKAPYDFESAEKYKDENLGLTVRELTYEVRHAWRLAKDYKAIIVSKIEEGSASAIAGVKTYELITKIEEQPVGSITDFKKIIEALAKDATKEKARFTLEKMGKSHFADVSLKKLGQK